MDSFFSRFRNSLTLVVLIIVQVLALAIQVQKPAPSSSGGEGRKTTLLRHWMLAVMAPVERVSYSSGSGVRHLWWNYIDLRHTREHDQALEQEITRLRTEQAQFAEDAREGRRLEALLQFKQKYIAATVAAQIIAASGSDRSRLLTLDKGSTDGLRPDMAVMTPDGVAGKLRDVSSHTSQLELLSDPNSGAGVILTNARIRGILRGTADGRVEINNLTRDSRIKPGDEVITSGGDGVFPRGLPVGVIESITDDPQHQPYTAIVIHTAANLQRLEEVLVITQTQSTLTPDAQRDAADAEATADAQAAANRRAADMIAERLPSLHDTTDPNAAADAPKTDATGAPITTVPRPKVAATPDRYSPNTTPPAEQLQPGAPAAKSDSDSKGGDH